MPISRQRKTEGKGRSIRKRKGLETKIVDGEARMPNKAFNLIRERPELLAFVRIGRVVNALGFSIHILKTPVNESSHVDARQSARAMFVFAGFIHEALNVIRSMETEYSAVPAFDSLKGILSKGSFKKPKAIVDAIRNRIGFHLDYKEILTSKTLKTARLSEYYVIHSGYDDEPNGLYINLADDIDWEYLVDTFASKKSEGETAQEILDALVDLSLEISRGSKIFLGYLLDCLGIKPPLKL